jgi:predicted ArsR family transcriptional regulator
MDRSESGIAKAAVLADEQRRAIYRFVRSAGRPVTREDVAQANGISWRLAAFHLEKLLGQDLLKAHYARPPERGGPGAGRSAKYYEPSDVQIEVMVPDRRYDIAGRLLVEAIQSEEPGELASETLLRVAAERGRELGEEVRRSRRLRRPGPERALAVLEDVLTEDGFEPYRDDRRVVALRNCPFHSLAKLAPGLVCEMNRSFLDGVLRGTGNDSVDAVLACKPGDCCVTLRAPGAPKSPPATGASSG